MSETWARASIEQYDGSIRYGPWMKVEDRMNPFLESLLAQLQNVTIDVPKLLADPEFPPAALKLLGLLLKYAKPKA